MTDMKDIKKMSDQDLEKLVTEQREILQKFRFGTGGRDVKGARAAKTVIARALQELADRTRVNTNAN